MICFAKLGLTEDLYVVYKEEFSLTFYICAIRILENNEWGNLVPRINIENAVPGG
jgi:hypothetical protein